MVEVLKLLKFSYKSFTNLVVVPPETMYLTELNISCEYLAATSDTVKTFLIGFGYTFTDLLLLTSLQPELKLPLLVLPHRKYFQSQKLSSQLAIKMQTRNYLLSVNKLTIFPTLVFIYCASENTAKLII